MAKNSLISKLSRYLFLILGITLVLATFSNFWLSSHLIKEEIEQSSFHTVKRSSDYLSEYFIRLKNIVDIVADHRAVKTFIEHQESEALYHLIEDLLKTDTNLKGIVLITKEGRIISNEEKLELKTSSNMMEEAWYVEAIHQDAMPLLTSAFKANFDAADEQWFISVSKEILDEQGHNLAVLRIDVKYEAIASYLDQLDLGQSGYAFIVDEKQDLVYHPDKAVYQDNQRQKQLMQIAGLNQSYTPLNTYVVQQPIAHSKWTMVLVRSLENLIQARQRLFFAYTLVFLSLSFIAYFGLKYLLKKWLSPLNLLSHTMLTIQEQQFKNNVPLEKMDSEEFKSLAHHFNTMLERIRTLMALEKEQQEALRQYELEALSSQINPHFLYNTLDTILWMAEFQDMPRVVSITQSLAKFFRLSLNQGKALISLKDELDHVRQYLAIQQHRYEHLHYEIKAEQAFNDFQLPKLVLQPIVENAIYHGIKGLAREGKILIETYKENQQLVLKIWDNGQGFKAHQEPCSPKIGGVGLKNVIKRLKLHFKENFDYHIQSEPGLYTAVLFYFKLKDTKPFSAHLGE